MTQDVRQCWVETDLAALCQTFSIMLTSFSAYRSKTAAAYLRISQTAAIYIVSFCLLVTDLEVVLEEAKCLIGFVGSGMDMGTPVHVIQDVGTKVCYGADGFKGGSS